MRIRNLIKVNALTLKSSYKNNKQVGYQLKIVDSIGKTIRNVNL